MLRSPKIIAGIAALTVGLLPFTVAAREPDEAVADLLVAEHDDHDVTAPHEGLVVFGADARIDGHRVDDELFLALGHDDTYPFLASVWLLVDAEADEWVPICLGYLLGGDGDDDRAVFVGGSTLGDEDDGCLIVPLGDEEDDAGVVFGAIELEGDSVATAALYAIG